MIFNSQQKMHVYKRIIQQKIAKKIHQEHVAFLYVSHCFTYFHDPCITSTLNSHRTQCVHQHWSMWWWHQHLTILKGLHLSAKWPKNIKGKSRQIATKLTYLSPNLLSQIILNLSHFTKKMCRPNTLLIHLFPSCRLTFLLSLFLLLLWKFPLQINKTKRTTTYNDKTESKKKGTL